MSEHTPDPCPIHTLDDAVMWLATLDASIEIFQGDEGRPFISVGTIEDDSTREIGAGGFDARGTLMMAARGLWQKLNGGAS